MAVKVKKIVLEINDKKIELSVEEARELQKLLGDTLGREKEHHYHSYPIYIERPWYYECPHYPYWTVTTGGSTVTYSSSSNTSALGDGIAVT